MNRKWTSATVTILLLLAGVGWAASFLGEDPRITELNQMREDRLQNGVRMAEEKQDQFRDLLNNRRQQRGLPIHGRTDEDAFRSSSACWVFLAYHDCQLSIS